MGHFALKLFGKYTDLLALLTNYYPFSQFYRYKLFHAENRNLTKFINKIDAVARKIKLPAYCIGWEHEGSFLIANYKFLQKPKSMERSVKKFEKALQEKFGAIYIRKKDKDKMKILIPVELL